MKRALRAICLLASIGAILAAVISTASPEGEGVQEVTQRATQDGAAPAPNDETTQTDVTGGNPELIGLRPASKPNTLPEAASADEPTDQATQTASPPSQTEDTQIRGPVTNLPLPRFVSLKGTTGNARRGPSLSHRIDWVFRHAGMPLRVTAEYGHWRRIEDRDGAGGWVHYALLSGVRTAIIEDDNTALKARPDAASGTVALASMGAIVRLGACTIDWCDVAAGSEDGWVPKEAIWGVDANELRE